MKKRLQSLLLVLFLSVAANFVSAQTNFIAEIQNLNGADTSIIREWRDGYAVIYSTSPYNGGYFHLVEEGNTSVITVVTDYLIKDMEIVGDTLYYCGINSFNNSIVGYFTITDLFMYNCYEHTFIGSGSNLIPRRLEAFHVSDGFHILVLYDNHDINDSVNRVLHDLIITYSGIYGCYSIDFESIEYCDDIVVTDNYVVTVGHKHLSAGIYMRKFYKPICASMSSSIPYGNIGYSISGFSPYNDVFFYDISVGTNVIGDYPLWDHPVWGTHIGGDSVAIAFSAWERGNGRFGASVNRFYVPSMTPLGDDLFIPYGSSYVSTNLVRDLRFSPFANQLLMLYDAGIYSTFSPEKLLTVIDNITFGSATAIFTGYGIDQHSLDKFEYEKAGFISMTSSGKNLSGVVSDIGWCLSYQHSDDCFNTVALPVEKVNNGILKSPKRLDGKIIQLIPILHDLEINDNETYIICSPKNK